MNRELNIVVFCLDLTLLIGRIASQARYRIEGGDMLGWTAAAKLASGNVNFDMGYSNVLGDTVGKKNAGLLFVSASLKW
jgi:hypothetical protein